MPDHQFAFAPFRLDLVNEQLWQGEEVVPLRPKLFAVLRYLVEHAGRLVTQEELRTAIWSTTVISESVLRGAIRELRDVLGDDVTAARFVETVPHRGYRFVAPLTAPQPIHAVVLSGRQFAPQRAPQPQPLILIGRDAELARLQEWQERALGGMRQVVFVTGEPGIGKTTLVDTFLARAASSDGLWTARGQCIEHYGPSEAYLPVLEALGQLCRGPGGAHVIPLLSRYAPTWLAQMPGLLGEAELAAVQRRAQGTTRERMLRELAEALEALTASTPLVLVLEDLHWSDYSTLDLLSLLAQRRGPARLLLLGTYRPADVIVSGHPLKALKQELRVHGRCEELPLRFFTEVEVAQYVAARFPQQQLPFVLGRTIHQSTEGNPLFMVNVVDYWVSQSVFVETAGQWQLAARVEDLAAGVPESLRQMIEKQLGRLTAEERRLLEAASVAGVEFSTAAVAAGLEETGERVEEWCEGLAKQEQFLRARGTETGAEGTITGRYGFRHALYQQVLYERAAVVRRVRLHRRLGEWGERAYGARAAEHAAELAVHFERGQDYARAVHYCYQAGQHARERFATTEALQHFRHGLTLLAALPETRERKQHELSLLIALGTALWRADPELGAAYTRANSLAQQLALPVQRFMALDGLVCWHVLRGEFQRAKELGEQSLALAQELNDPVLQVRASAAMASAMFHCGELQMAYDLAAYAIARYDTLPSRSAFLLHGEDPKVPVLLSQASVLWLLGYPEQACQQSLAALRWARELTSPFGIVVAYGFIALLQQCGGTGTAVHEWAERAVTLASEHGSRLWEGVGRVLWGWSLAVHEHQKTGLAQLQQGVTLLRTVEGTTFQSYALALQADAYSRSRQVKTAFTLVSEALAQVENTGERWYEPELHRLKGELLLNAERGTMNDEFKTSPVQRSSFGTHRSVEAEAEACFLKAIAVSRTQQAKSLELRAAMSLARLWQRQGKKKQARRMLADIYGWFTEGFDTVDLKEAKALLQTLS